MNCYTIFLSLFQRTLGLRFLYPVYYIPEVEITPNKYTAAVAIEKGMYLSHQVGNRFMGCWTSTLLLLSTLIGCAL